VEKLAIAIAKIREALEYLEELRKEGKVKGRKESRGEEKSRLLKEEHLCHWK